MCVCVCVCVCKCVCVRYDLTLSPASYTYKCPTPSPYLTSKMYAGQLHEYTIGLPVALRAFLISGYTVGIREVSM